MTEATERFSALADLQTSHDDLLDRRERLPAGDEAAASFWAEAAAFVRRAQVTGAILDTSRDRRAAQSILDYWANALYRAGRPAAEARLADFNPDLAPALPDEPCLYRGLAAFRETDRDFFFGREGLLNEMVGRLRDGERLLAVVGSSGSGKSSVVLAGLLPRLKAGALPGSAGWRYATIVPGSQPLTSLDRALRILGETPAVPLLLVVDQFEELFTLCNDEDERTAFVGQLLGLITAADSSHRVILTMRTDFVDSVAKLPELFPLFRDGRVDVEALDINELRAAIEGPAARVGLKFEEGIVDDLISTILGERAGLPLLQFTLLRLWNQRQRNRVTREVYRQVGHPRQALERAAETFYGSLIPEEQETAKRILLRMVRPGEGREVTSNRIRRDEVFREGEARDRVAHVLNRLIEAGLVKLSVGETEADAQIEVAHEALVRNWPRLVGWLDEERETLRRRRRLTSAAGQWRRLDRNPDALLRGALLEEAQRYGDLNGLEQEFIAASRGQAEAERQREMLRQVEIMRAQEQAQMLKRLRKLVITLCAVSLLAVLAAALAVVLGRRAAASEQKVVALWDENAKLKTTVIVGNATNATLQQAFDINVKQQMTSEALSEQISASPPQTTAALPLAPTSAFTPTPTLTVVSTRLPTATMILIATQTVVPPTSSPTVVRPTSPPTAIPPTSTQTAISATDTPTLAVTLTPTPDPIVVAATAIRATQTAVVATNRLSLVIDAYNQGERAQCIRLADEALKPGVVEDNWIKWQLYKIRGLAYYFLPPREESQALENLDKAIALHKDNADMWKIRGYIYLQGKNWEGAQKDFEEAIKLDRDDWTSYFNLGLTYYELGQRENNLEQLKKAKYYFAIVVSPRMSPSTKTYYHLGLVNYVIGYVTSDVTERSESYKEAIREFRKAIELNDAQLELESSKKYLAEACDKLRQTDPSGYQEVYAVCTSPK